eukprot:COSAG06_NODE_4372_length_4322_cov_88.764386_2_plen_69_part_00
MRALLHCRGRLLRPLLCQPPQWRQMMAVMTLLVLVTMAVAALLPTLWLQSLRLQPLWQSSESHRALPR